MLRTFAIAKYIYRLIVRQLYLMWKREAWSIGYNAYRNHYIENVLRDDELLTRFAATEDIPSGYGIGLDERCIEYPWFFSRIDGRYLTVLDAGAALNHDFILNQPYLVAKNIHILTLGPEQNAFWRYGISYLYDDIRQLPIRDDHYDMVACISTLEHIGFDNQEYVETGAYQENQPDDFLSAITEMRRVLKPGARLYLTVPFGRYGDFGTYQVFDRKLLDEVIMKFEPVEVEEVFYKYEASGWQIAEAEACKDCEYVYWDRQFEKRFPIQPDGAVAARAVACVVMRKGD